MSNQDQYGGKGQGGGADPNDDWDSLTDEQKMQRKQPYIDQDQQGGSGKPGEGQRMDLGDDFDSLSDDQKIARKQEYAQRDPGQYGSQEDDQGGSGGGKY